MSYNIEKIIIMIIVSFMAYLNKFCFYHSPLFFYYILYGLYLYFDLFEMCYINKV